MTVIIIVTYNNFEDTKQCVESCLRLSTNNVTIIVVDNGSSDNSSSKLQFEFNGKINLIQLPTNTGYAHANNVGISYALQRNAQYIWLINNDTIVTPSSLNNLTRTSSTIKGEAILGSKILNWPDMATIDFLGGTYNHRNGTCTHLHRNSPDTLSFTTPILCDFITGCSIFFTPGAIQKIGYLPEDYFLYCEDVDWCLSAKRLDIPAYVVPQSVVYHKLHATTRKHKNAIIYYNTRNTLFLLEKTSGYSNVAWHERFLLDLKVFCSYLIGFNLRAAYNLSRAYLSWIRGLKGPEFKKVKVRRNVFLKTSET